MIVVPGIGNSGPEHWQSRWQSDTDVRLAPSSWDEPDLDDWVGALDRAVLAAPGDVLVAHSLGCLAVASWLAAAPRDVSAAMLVAPPDPSGASFPVEATGFRDLATAPSDTAILVVASSDDPYASVPYSREFAAAIGARYVAVGPRGHLNSASGLGAWEQGRALLAELCGTVDRAR